MEDKQNVGEWITYDDSNYDKLQNSLEGTNVIKAVEMIKNIVLPEKGRNSNYHIYYVNEGDSRIPALLVVTDENRIVDCCGNDRYYRIDFNLLDTLVEKLDEFHDYKELDYFTERCQDMKKIAEIKAKTDKKEKLTSDEISLLYERQPIGKGGDFFSQQYGFNISEIRRERIQDDLLYNPEVTETILKEESEALKYIDPNRDDYIELAKIAFKYRPEAIKFIPTNLPNY